MIFFAHKRPSLLRAVLVVASVLSGAAACSAPVPGAQPEQDPAGPEGGAEVARGSEAVTPDPDNLEGEWWVTEVVGLVVEADRTRRRRPHVRFDVEQRRVSFTGGCNQFAGTVELEGPDGIAMAGPFAGTRMLCPGRADYDQALTDALRSVSRWRLVSPGNDDRAVLEMFDGTEARASVRLVRPSSSGSREDDAR